jgi:hypothetical protein
LPGVCGAECNWWCPDVDHRVFEALSSGPLFACCLNECLSDCGQRHPAEACLSVALAVQLHTPSPCMCTHRFTAGRHHFWHQASRCCCPLSTAGRQQTRGQHSSSSSSGRQRRQQSGPAAAAWWCWRQQ